ncbi:MAG: slipin family protein [Planctomycetota bacterium]
MFPFRRFQIRTWEMGLLFRDGEFQGLLSAGTHLLFDPMRRLQVDIVSQREPALTHEKLDLIIRSGTLEGRALVLDLQDHQRALVWIDDRFSQVLPPGQHAFWTAIRKIRVEIQDVRAIRFQHEQLRTIVRSPQASGALEICTVQRERAGVLFIDGRCADVLQPGEYAFWRGSADVRVVEVDLREAILDVGGQDMMTADKVTLRINAVVTWKATDPRRMLSQSEDARQALYRDIQMVLRGVVGSRELDSFLTDRDGVSREIDEGVRRRAGDLGVEITAVGIRDVILPGDMKELMNRVTEARKAAEANLIARREETAAIRSQANTAKLLAESPTLMRLRELETLEKIAAAGKLNIILGDKGLAERLITML